MTQPYDAQGFAQYVEENFIWRIKEISDLKRAILETAISYRPTLRKSAVPLLYAHWEGHVNFVVESYLKYIARRKLLFNSLSLEIRAVALHGFFKKNFNYIPNYEQRVDLIGQIYNTSEKRFAVIAPDCVDTGSNLNYERTRQLSKLIGIDFPFGPFDEAFMDQKLLSVRNQIAHSADKTVSDVEFEEISDRTIDMMRAYRDAVINLVALERYKIRSLPNVTPKT